ncbi:MAG TPA: hypothetical protein VGB51_10800 [Actinomycetota bacterium]
MRRPVAASDGRATVRGRARVALLLVLATACGGERDAGAGSGGPRPPSVPVVGEVAPLPGGAVARVNGVRFDVTLAPGLPPPEPGTSLVRLDVELCAGAARLRVDPAFWLGLGRDGAVYSAHSGVQGLLTFTLAPGTCQRGDVDIAVDDGVGLEEVLLMGLERTTVARWSVGGDPVPPEEPLDSGLTPLTVELGSEVRLAAGAAVTLRGFDPASDDGPSFRLEVEVCAGESQLQVGPRSWLLQLADHRLIVPDPDGGTLRTGSVEPGGCQQGEMVFVQTSDADAVAVIYTADGAYEEARWSLVA